MHSVSVVFEINSEFIAQFSDSFSRLVVHEQHDVVVEVNELEDLLHFQVSSERFHGRSHQDNVVVEVLVELLDVDGVSRGARDQFELQSMVAAAHLLNVVKEDRMCL